MWRGIYTAATGMIAEMHRTDTLANNLANADTTGYKRDEAISREFEPMLIRRINDDDRENDVTSFKGFSIGKKPPVVGDLGLGSYIREVATNHEQGALMTTGNQYDVAIAGNGYFVVQTPQGERYTRDGSFYRSLTGELRTTKGQTLLTVAPPGAQPRPIRIPDTATEVVFGPKGEVFADGQQVGQLRFVEFDDRRAILKQGDNLYYAQEGVTMRPATGEIVQGSLERSNTQIVMEMVELINNYRVYEAGSKAVTTQDSMLDKAVSEVGRVSG